MAAGAHTLLAELPASALRLAAGIGENRFPLVIEPQDNGVQVRALVYWGFVEVNCRDAWAAERVLMPPAPVRSMLGRHSDAEVVSITQGPTGGLLLRSLGESTAVASLIPRDHSDGYGIPPERPAGGGPVTVSATFLGRLLAQIRVLTDEVRIELAAPDEPIAVHFAAEGMTGRCLLCPIFRKEGN
jgi:hypothetical protein